MRFAILTAVSSRVQAAEGKDSLPVQEENCRRTALAKGWNETSGPFVISGQPRTGYVNLTDAEREMPALAAMLDSARDGAFDVLVLYDYSRLRDLIALVAASLADYNVQIYSLAQAVEPLPPDQFDPAQADAAWFTQTAAGMTSRAEINALKRRFRIGMPGRVTNKGLHPLGRLPYGYRKPPGRELDRQVVPEPDPATAPAVRMMRDLLLTGRSLVQIASALDASGYPTRFGKPWHPDSIRRILRNPYYAGVVTFGVLRRQKDSRHSRKGRVVRSSAPVHSGPGKHVPLWDETTRRRILDELDRRGRSYSGRRLSRFSGLLFCADCRRPLWVGYHTWPGHPPSDRTRVYFCSSRIPGHPRLKEPDLLPAISDRLVDELRHVETLPQLPLAEDPLPFLRKQAADLDLRQARLTEAYLSGAIPLPEFNTLKADLSARQARSRDALLRFEDTAARQAERLEGRRSLADRLEHIPGFLRTADPQTVNAALHQVLDRILVTVDGELELFWRS
jgi:DNA invertase Pin-like site-specific DNA recombinase